jgi:hypothetical protein
MSGQRPEDAVNRIELLSWLKTIERDFDPVLLEARKQYPASGWVGVWLARSLLGIKYKRMPEDSIQKTVAFFSSRATLWSAWLVAIAGNAALAWIRGFDDWQWLAGIVLLAAAVAGSLKSNLTRMLAPGDPYFNSSAYKLFRPKEYFMFLNYLKENKHTFGTVAKWVELLYNEHSLDHLIREHQAINEQLRRESREFKASLERSERNLRTADIQIDLLNRKIELLIQQVSANENGFNAAIDVIYRLRRADPKLFTPNDLRVLTAFSLFELEGDVLYRICEQGTTETPPAIHLDDPNYARYSSVKLVHSDNTIEYATSDREGRTVASYWIELPSERVVIYNFHFESTNRSIHAIIESKEMYRFIRGICIHLEERGLLEREGIRHAEA